MARATSDSWSTSQQVSQEDGRAVALVGSSDEQLDRGRSFHTPTQHTHTQQPPAKTHKPHPRQLGEITEYSPHGQNKWCSSITVAHVTDMDWLTATSESYI